MESNHSTDTRIETLKLEVITLIIEENNLPFDQAEKDFESSITNQLLMDISTNIYQYTKEEIFALWKKERRLLNQFYTEEMQKMMPTIAQELLNTPLYKTVPVKEVKKSKRKILTRKSPKYSINREI